jgi:uncharacterized integral membrane protein (TIGR00698 family)
VNNASPKTFSPLPGLGVAIIIAVIATIFSFGHAALDPLVLSILIGIVLGNLLGPYENFKPGILLAQRVFIPLGIILYGTQMDVRPLQTYGTGRVLHIFAMVLVGLLVIYGISRKLGISGKIGMLLSAGTAICGASAIMVLSPVIKAEREDTSISLLSITIVGLCGVILYPIVQELISLPDRLYALLCGSTLNQLGQVKAAASFMGHDVINMAVPVKLLRMATLLPIAVAYSLITGRETKKVYIPWFIIGFIIVAVLVNAVPGLHAIREVVSPYVAFCFSIALAGIGLSVDIESIIDVGPKPLLAAFLGWIVLIALFILGVTVVK